jgi:outer membrane protein OmpA-like peptidoglycan-associated protein
MAKLNNNITILTLMTFAVFSLLACAGTQTSVQSISKSANPADVVNEFDGEIATARKNQLNVLSPNWFSKAEASLARAKKALNKGDEILEIMENVAEGRAQLKRAEEMAQVARTTLPELIKSREMARAAGATKINEYSRAEDDFLMLTKAIEDNNLRLAQRERGRVSKDFRALELRAIKDQTIGEVRKLLAQAENDGARKYAPHSLSMAQQKLKNTDAFITQNPYEKAKMQEMANDALFYARRLIQMNKQSQKIRTMESEEIARWIEDMLHQTTAKLSAPDMRNEPFEIQVENLVESVSALQADHSFVIQQTKEQEAGIVALKKRIAALEGESKEQQAAKERLAAEKKFNEKFVQIQNYFEPEEAEVYKQGNQLVIRLKSIQFPVGKDTIMPKNYETLSSVQSAIRTFGEPDVIIEGHTDSTGSDEVNEHLSQQRAEAVRQYLVANRTLPYDRIVALGYGSMRPLASNQTAEGRAINRRIDVIVRPSSQPAQ